MSAKLIQIASNLNTSVSANNSQFKHTIFWNSIIENLKATLVESYNSNKLKKQHSRFVAVSMGGMLLMKQNLSMSYNAGSDLNPQTTSSCSSNSIHFTGSQCVDIVFSYLTSNHAALHLEREVTREKVTKLCQMIMDTGAFEPASRASCRFDDTSLRYYKFKHEQPTALASKRAETAEKSKLSDITKTTLSYSNKENVPSTKDTHLKSSDLPTVRQKHVEFNGVMTKIKDVNPSQLASSTPDGSSASTVSYNKAKLPSRHSSVNTKLKRKLATAMTRSNTVNTLIPLSGSQIDENTAPGKSTDSHTVHALASESKKSQASSENQANFFSSLTHSISNEFLTSPIKKMFIKDKNVKPQEKIALDNHKTHSSAASNFNTKLENKPNSHKLAQELLMTRQITRELIIEKLLSLIDLPVIEHLLVIDERNDIEYCQALQKFDCLLGARTSMANLVNANRTNNGMASKTSTSSNEFPLKPHDNKFENLKNLASSVKLDSHSHINKLLSKSSLNIIQKSLAILNQKFDPATCELNDEWRKSALECLEFIDWQKLANKPVNKDGKSQAYEAQSTVQVEPSATATAALIKALINSANQAQTSQQQQSADKNLTLMLLNDREIYDLLQDYYTHRQMSQFYFLDDSFQPLFVNILGFIRTTHYDKALEILNLGTLLLLKQTQAELKRLLKFLHLTANNAFAPKLSDSKPNNSIVLNHFASCLINTKLIGYEETRLLLNFMLNNFDDLFVLNTSIVDSISKRRGMMQKHGNDEAFIVEKPFCKQMSKTDYSACAKEQTNKALVDLINHIIDDPQITLKQKKLKLKALKRIHPDIYEQHFAGYF